LRPYALLYLYRRRLRVHRAQELLAGLGVAVAVALVFAATVANDSITGSASAVVRVVAGPASLQLHARAADGMDERLLARVERLPGVARAAPMLEQTASIRGPHGILASVDLAGANLALTRLDGLANTLPAAALSSGGIGLSATSARELGVGTAGAGHGDVVLQLRGAAHALPVAAVLGPESAGALSQARVAVMSLAHLQQLAGLEGRVTRILIETEPGRKGAVRRELQALADGRITVAAADADVGLLRQALRPSEQASGFFAAISALLGFLFAFNAMLLTVPERRQAIADLRLNGVGRVAIVQIVAFQALCLGAAASLIGVLAGYALSLGALRQSSGYLAEAFTLGTNTVVTVRPLLLAVLGGLLATLLASAVPLRDLQRRRPLDAVYFEDGSPGNALGRRGQLRLALAAATLAALATALFELRASLAFIASGVLALATMLAVPLALAGVLWVAAAVARRCDRLTVLQVALASLRATTVRSLALASMGAVAIFGSVALGGARSDLLRGIDGFARSYAADADLWVGNAGDNQATVPFAGERYAARIARVRGVSAVSAFQGGFLELGDRRVWVIARPPGSARMVLASQIVAGEPGRTIRRLSEGGWIAVSRQIAQERHLGLGDLLALPTPTGTVRFRIAATTSNLAWSPGVIFMSAADYSRFWDTTSPTALGVMLARGTNVSRAQAAVARVLGPASGLEVSTAGTRQARIEALTSEGLSRLGEISTLLVIAAVLAMAAALSSSIWQRRASLAGLRLAGVRARRLRRILLMEATLMMGAGCLAGAVAGVYGQVIIDGYLERVTGFPVANLAASGRPFAVLALVVALVLAIVAIPGWSASRVSPTLALNE
jgi:putative ABC transport system permease protein